MVNPASLLGEQENKKCSQRFSMTSTFFHWFIPSSFTLKHDVPGMPIADTDVTSGGEFWSVLRLLVVFKVVKW